MMTERTTKVAAVMFEKGQDVDTLLEMVVRDIQAKGHVVQGYLQREIPTKNCRLVAVHLESIADGTVREIFQHLGRDARGCRLDPQALTGLCMSLQAALSSDTELAVFNRFGKGEAEGTGLRAAIEQAFLYGIPVLTAVRPEYLQDWRLFTGGWHVELELTADALATWVGAVIPSLPHREGDYTDL